MSLNHLCSGTGSGGVFNPRFNTLIVDNGIQNTNQPVFYGNNTSTQTITSGTTSQISTYSSLSATNPSYFGYSAGTFTIVYDGTYLIQAYNKMAAAATGIRYLAISINGNEIAQVTQDASATNNATLETQTIRFITGGSTVQIMMYQNSGGNLACNNPGTCTIYKLS